MEQLYQFTSQWYADGRSEHLVCQGRAAFIRLFISQPEFLGLFGGFVLSADLAGEEYLGVWGRRMDSRLRRVLRERGAEFTVSTQPPVLRLKVMSTGNVDGV